MAEKKHNHTCDCEHEHEETCDCGCEHEETCDCGCEHDDLIVLHDSEGNEVPFHYVYDLEHEGKHYVYLQPADEEEDYLEIFELNTVEENGETYDMWEPVDDDLYEVLYQKLLLVASEDACENEECDCGCHDDEEEE